MTTSNKQNNKTTEEAIMQKQLTAIEASIKKIKLNIDNQQTITTSSQQIAEVFSKQHAKILRDIDNLECSDEFSQANFGLAKYKDTQGKMRKSYNITKDGFIFLVMGFTGKKAAQFKEAYINEFNRMQANLQSLKNKELLEEYSTVVKMTTVDGKKHNTRVFNEEGAMIIAMKSNKPKAIEFQKWAVNILKQYRLYNKWIYQAKIKLNK